MPSDEILTFLRFQIIVLEEDLFLKTGKAHHRERKLD